MKPIQLTNQERVIIKNILKNYHETVLFGSRIKETAKKFSDLDVCLKEAVKPHEYELLKEQFEESDLPFMVDLVEYAQLNDTFKKLIDAEGVSINTVD